MAMDCLFLNPRTVLLCTLMTKIVFFQTAKNSSHQLQEMQFNFQAQTPPIIRSQKTSAMFSSGISKFQKNKAELLASRLQHWNLLHNSVKAKFQSSNFQRTAAKSDGFEWNFGVQYVDENALFIFTPEFLCIKLWCRQRRTRWALPSRHFSDAAQVQMEMERCHVKWLLLDDAPVTK